MMKKIGLIVMGVLMCLKVAWVGQLPLEGGLSDVDSFTQLPIRVSQSQKVLESRGVSGQKLERLSVIYDALSVDVRDVMLAMHYVESRYDSLAVSPWGDCGIGQINPRWWSGRNLREFLFDSELPLTLTFEDVVFSAELGVCYSTWILRKFLEKSDGDLGLALKLYNGTWAYANRVLGLYNE